MKLIKSKIIALSGTPIKTSICEKWIIKYVKYKNEDNSIYNLVSQF